MDEEDFKRVFEGYQNRVNELIKEHNSNYCNKGLRTKMDTYQHDVTIFKIDGLEEGLEMIAKEFGLPAPEIKKDNLR